MRFSNEVFNCNGDLFLHPETYAGSKPVHSDRGQVEPRACRHSFMLCASFHSASADWGFAVFKVQKSGVPVSFAHTNTRYAFRNRDSAPVL